MRRKAVVKNEANQGGQSLSVELADVRLKTADSTESYVLFSLPNLEHLYDFLTRLVGA
jgi:hypothetical protein